MSARADAPSGPPDETPGSGQGPAPPPEAAGEPPGPETTPGSGRAAGWVAAGIFLSRVSGFVRESVFAFFFGTSPVADVWRAALRTPNVVQNLLGEGTLSASFIPVYAEMLEEGREEEAGRFAGAVLGLLSVAAFGIALVGILLAPVFIPLFFFEWDPWQHDLGIVLVRILFLMTAFLAISAWALGILNSHRRFFVSYVAPVVWNGALVTTLLVFGGWGGWEPRRLVVALAWGALAGGILQVAVQLPWVIPALRGFRLSVSRRVEGVREAIRNFGPVVAARGVVNLSGWLDVILAGLLADGAIALLGYAQTLYLLPISLFGMSIAASELPELSRRREEARSVVVPRVRTALRRVAFFVVPSALAYLVLGDVLTAALFERGRFDRLSTTVTYGVLAAYALGLLASAWSRVLSSAYYALRDTRTPAWIATVRVVVSLGVGVGLMFPLDRVAVGGGGDQLRFGATGLALGAAAGAWVELVLLRLRLHRALGPHGPGPGYLARLALAGVGAAAAGAAAKAVLGSLVPARTGWIHALVGAESALLAPLLALGTALVFGGVYLGLAGALGVGLPLRRLLPGRSR